MKFLTKTDIVEGLYKNEMGKADTWEQRGACQLEFLVSRGLKKDTKFLDAGCGPLRAGIHFIRYLNPGCYTGFDHNESCIAASHYIVDQNNLRYKEPILQIIRNYDWVGLGCFDMALSFSSLTHKPSELRNMFFMKVHQVLAPGGKLYISHGWSILDDLILKSCQLKISERIDYHEAFTKGWPSKNVMNLFPIIEFQR